MGTTLKCVNPGGTTLKRTTYSDVGRFSFVLSDDAGWSQFKQRFKP